MGRTPRPTMIWTPGEADLFTTAIGWLREDRVVRRAIEEKRGRVRGAKKDTSYSDAKTFFEKYDYSAR